MAWTMRECAKTPGRERPSKTSDDIELREEFAGDGVWRRVMVEFASAHVREPDRSTDWATYRSVGMVRASYNCMETVGDRDDAAKTLDLSVHFCSRPSTLWLAAAGPSMNPMEYRKRNSRNKRPLGFRSCVRGSYNFCNGVRELAPELNTFAPAQGK